ncbi:MAG TPA: glycoside hydrolase family 15 protein, partial [Actinospica sp.]|nr:glycoside hydrolase family 15 protein [Actinospica sp.]
MRRYPPIGEHGMIGDLQSCALISSDGVLDFFCAPRFDSPSLFASLVDHDKGGYIRLAADDTEHGGAEISKVRQLYLPDTAILVTRFMSHHGVGEVVDFMPLDRSERASANRRIIRILRVVRGNVKFVLECRPRFDYARAEHELGLRGDQAAVFRGPGLDLHLQSTFPFRREGEDVVGTVTLGVGETAAVVLDTTLPGVTPRPVTLEELEEEHERTTRFWQDWLRGSSFQGRWQTMVHRSAITLKLLTYAPTGAPIASATFGLPEQIGGERNWDYRYCWVRDGALSSRAMAELGFVEEADAFRRWLTERLRDRRHPGKEPLQIMYRIDGEPLLAEEELGHLEGYEKSAPVRIGNAAADQLQLDVYGEAIWALTQSRELAEVSGYQGWQVLADVIGWLAANWDRPDEGIWETRGGRKDFTFSRLMCWVALDRGIRLAQTYARPADLAGWTAARDEILRQVMQRGWSKPRQAFVQHYNGDVLDASLLFMPIVGFISPRDPLWLSTLEAIEQDLVTDSLVHRYDPSASPDGLRGNEGTFNLCTFLYVDALARAGRLDHARYAFDKMLTYANHV